MAALVADWGSELVGEHGLSAVGAVVGATHPRAVSEARKLMPQAVLLLPGVGAQGATPADLARAFTSGPASALVNASRSVNYAFRERRRATSARPRRRGGAAAGRDMERLGLVAAPGRRTWRALAAPAAALLAATVAIGFLRGELAAARTRPTAQASARVQTHAPARHPQRVYVVRAGDTIEGISSRTGVPQARILALNPKVSPTALFIGEKLRLR